MFLHSGLSHFVSNINYQNITEERRQVLHLLIDFIQQKVIAKDEIKLNFICTHNSRRSHLAQIWAQCIGHYFKLNSLQCYSGGTEETAVFPMIIKTLENSGFHITKLSELENPKYSIEYSKNAPAITAFSKRFDNDINPKSNFAAIMTCSQAEQECPLVLGAEKRISLPYEDPKEFDSSPQQEEKYQERSLQIATELHYVFSKIKSSS